jgi:outer membrane lipoprotein-sorting protein
MGMKSRVKALSVIMGVLILFWAGLAAAEDFSADMVSTSQGAVSKGKIYITKDKVRMEAPGSIAITRIDKKVVWVLMPQDKMYMEQPFDPGAIVGTAAKVSNEIERNLMGQEMVDGKMASKYRVIYDQNGKRTTIYQWFLSGLKIPVKTAAVDNSWVMEYKNIKTGSQPDSLFELPAGYQKFSYQMPSMKDALRGIGR